MVWRPLKKKSEKYAFFSLVSRFLYKWWRVANIVATDFVLSNNLVEVSRLVNYRRFFCRRQKQEKEEKSEEHINNKGVKRKSSRVEVLNLFDNLSIFGLSPARAMMMEGDSDYDGESGSGDHSSDSSSFDMNSSDYLSTDSGSGQDYSDNDVLEHSYDYDASGSGNDYDNSDLNRHKENSGNGFDYANSELNQDITESGSGQDYDDVGSTDGSGSDYSELKDAWLPNHGREYEACGDYY